ncbi:MAG: RNA pyrophosphohydrolase [Alphaproteobacteria bacterium]|nr:RNA pyrophosphohydrolase [Alphaproteobacteria bacterium]
MNKKTKTATLPAQDGGAPWRLGTGMVLFDGRGRVLVAERRDTPGAWQFPQGGVDEGEEADPAAAAQRELREELGTGKARMIGRADGPLGYEFPDYLGHKAFKGKYRGQQQHWFAFLFEGEDSDIRLVNEHEAEQPEFTRFKWVELEEAAALIVDFKRAVYSELARQFGPLRDRIRAGKL